MSTRRGSYLRSNQIFSKFFLVSTVTPANWVIIDKLSILLDRGSISSLPTTLITKLLVRSIPRRLSTSSKIAGTASIAPGRSTPRHRNLGACYRIGYLNTQPPIILLGSKCTINLQSQGAVVGDKVIVMSEAHFPAS